MKRPFGFVGVKYHQMPKGSVDQVPYERRTDLEAEAAIAVFIN